MIKSTALLSLSSILVSLPNTANAFSPNNNYAPGFVSCPDGPLVREANNLSSSETAWLKKRDAVTQPILKEWLLKHANESNTQDLINSIYNSTDERRPRIAIAASGGGYRAMLSGAGMLSALDNRTTGANEHGLGGILQGSTYLAGLSGGNWLTGTLAFNDWISVQEIVDQTLNKSENLIWDIEDSIFEPFGEENPIKNYQRWVDIENAVKEKQLAGFDVSITDPWGRALAYNWFPSYYEGGEALTWSSLKDSEIFTNAEMPFIISVADSRYPNSTAIDLNTTVFEINPFELGSWDSSVNAFVNVQYVGTPLDDGNVVTSKCVEGFDNAGFIIGTSSSLFNEYNLTSGGSGLVGLMSNVVTDIYSTWNSTDYGFSVISPNPFLNTNYFNESVSEGSMTKAKSLYLADGGDDNQEIPFLPVIQEKRQVDIVFAFDSSYDTEEIWPDGTSLVATYERQFEQLGDGMAFPYIPSTETFVDEGLNKKPVFFGCNTEEMKNLTYIPPLIVYVPNSEYSFPSNTSTGKMSYTQEERLGMIQNGFEVMTRNNMTDDSTFATCISCAIIKRSQERLGASIPSECKKCYSDYCYN